MIRDLKLSRKFFYAFGFICALCILQGIAALSGLYKIDTLTRDLTLRSLPALRSVVDMREQIQVARRMELASLLCSDTGCTDAYNTRRNDALEKYRTSNANYLALTLDASERSQFETAGKQFDEYLDRSSEIMRAFAATGTFSTVGIGAKELQLLAPFNQALDNLNVLSNRYSKECNLDTTGVNENNSFLRWLNLGLMIAITGFCVVVGYALCKMIVPPIEQVTRALEQVAEKNLDVSVEVGSHDEIGRLSVALNTTVESMRTALHTVAQTAQVLAGTAVELSVRSSQTSSNTHTQTAKINQIAAAVHEMSATIGEISSNAGAAASTSRSSAETAARGGDVMQRAADTMAQIAEATGSVSGKMDSLANRSREIGKVVHVIQEISEQTNLLALNAAIEAARAGEHGRGFAVVAGEVRRLAERTKGATEEIAGTIRSMQAETHDTATVMNQSSSTVQAGLCETTEAQDSIESTITASRDLERMIELIATAASQQTSASSEISENAGEISQLANENSDAYEEIASACNNLSQLASDLDQVIGQFHFGNDV
jgi:methyl-accepting chemotaxis protein